MTDIDHFDIFNTIQLPVTPKSSNDCPHLSTIDENNLKICEDCGEEIGENISFDKEWRYYGASDTKHTSDPNRCHLRKTNDKNIYKDLENMQISSRIIESANRLYEEVTSGKIYRGNRRKAIIFACVFHTYKIQNNPQSCESLIKIFRLDRKTALSGLKYVNSNANKNSEIRTKYITPENLIVEIMKKFDSEQQSIDDIIEIYNDIKNRSSILNRSRPQSVATGLVRYYILLKNKNISMSDFRSKTELSDLTINKMVREICRIQDTEYLIR